MADSEPGSGTIAEAITEASVVRRSPVAATVAVDGHAVLVDEPDGRAHAVNPTAALVWECLDGTGDLAGLIDDLAEGFGVPRAEVADDVVGLVRDLARLGLLEGFGADAGAWPEPLRPDDDCAPDAPGVDDDRTGDTGTAIPSFDDRYLAAPPNG